MAIQTLIADDELLARQKLRQLLRGEPDIEIAGEASSAREVHELVQETTPQLLFLDVRMPGMDGLDVIAELSMRSVKLPRVILTSAYDHYALRAFELNATDYLLKPFTAERLHSAVERARDQIQAGARQPARTHSAEAAKPGPYTGRIVFKSRGRILKHPNTNKHKNSAEENYVRICTGTETHLLRETMTSLEQRLDPKLFLRVHRSAIVNLRYVKEVRSESRGDFMVHLVNGQKLAMSRSYRARIGDLLNRS